MTKFVHFWVYQELNSNELDLFIQDDLFGAQNVSGIFVTIQLMFAKKSLRLPCRRPSYGKNNKPCFILKVGQTTLESGCDLTRGTRGKEPFATSFQGGSPCRRRYLI